LNIQYAKLALCGLLMLLAACTINPVTGNRELALISADQEIDLGRQQYGPAQQMQGGAYTLDPALEAYVRGVGTKLAAVSDRPLPYEFVVLNQSVPNAWALPGGKIAVNRGLLTELNSEAELAAVLGHEIVHAAARHGALAMQRGLLLGGLVSGVQAAAGRGNFGGLVVGAAGVGAQLVSQRNSRENELEADQFGMQYMARAGYDPGAAVTLQETFVRLSQQGGAEQGRLAALFASHPPSTERVERNRAIAATLPKGGDVGRDRYAAATAALRERRPAYDAYDKGRAALEQNKIVDAERFAREAVRLLPAEAQFHGLLGDVALAGKQYDEAVRRYADAVMRNDAFFYYHLQKGHTHRLLSQWEPARAEFERSVQLLPTADAYYGLGVVAEQRGDRAGALENYSRAGQSEGAAGQAARQATVRLDLPVSPSRYLTARGTLDGNGRLVLELTNSSSVPVADVLVTVRYTDSQGASRSESQRMSGPVPPGQTLRQATGIGPLAGASGLEVTVASARVLEGA
jgi:beta-barrel assembly-enhancing protease